MSLFEACQRADVEKLEVFLEQNDVHQIDDQGRTALHYCAENSDIDCARLLLEDDVRKKFILNRQDQDGCSALHLGKHAQDSSYLLFIPSSSVFEWEYSHGEIFV